MSVSATADEDARTAGPAGPPRLAIGVTGGIGSGKTTAARLFQERGADMVDTDAIAHELTRTGGPALERIAARFGPQYLGADGALDRARLREHVFSDSQARRDLEAILHPLIRSEVEARVRASRAPYILLVIPLLAETGGYPELIRRVLVVDCDEQVQVQRTMQRSGLTETQVRAIMRTQASRSARLAIADDVLRNDGDLAGLAEQVRALDDRYRAMARTA